MTDMVERLRIDRDTPRDEATWRKVAKEAAAEIERLHAWRDAKNEACAELEKENERLRAALEPFAKMANEVEFWRRVPASSQDILTRTI